MINVVNKKGMAVQFMLPDYKTNIVLMEVGLFK